MKTDLRWMLFWSLILRIFTFFYRSLEKYLIEWNLDFSRGLPVWMDRRLFDIWHTLGLYLTMNCLTSTFFCILGIWIRQNTVFGPDMELSPHQTTASKQFLTFNLFCLYLHINSPWWNDHECSIDGKGIPLVDSFSFCSFQDLVWSHSNN